MGTVFVVFSVTILTITMLAPCANTLKEKSNDPLHEWALDNIKSRDAWRAKPPKGSAFMPNPVPFVIIHHSYIPKACYTATECQGAVKEMQRMHQDDNGWDDIGYSFAIGGDAKVYYGRGWHLQGAHAPTYNNRSIGINLVGDWTETIPTWDMLQAAKQLISLGVELGYIDRDYKLYGHRQVRMGTVCPGDALFNEIKTWDHWDANPMDVFDPNSTYHEKRP